jgi:hypothetical protein
MYISARATSAEVRQNGALESGVFEDEIGAYSLVVEFNGAPQLKSALSSDGA